ncbi:protein LATERAL ROOT PRIMORDIUM 1-like isoform X4 [Prunus dulcis]|uniref:protein LATERAL ROOT PRIMORDIUM 1-like isoform X4 n=1 Tax=Prunus dulcis TaxID=3755 RepID=UPI001482E69A|nr:protein LATERAL ROOT PRIMORDIUM 1-like isoform X4 [Prunus dulcis]
MLGLRDILLIAPTPSSMHQQNQPISSDLPLPSSTTLGVGLGIFPLLTATPCAPHAPTTAEVNSDNSHFWGLRRCQELNLSKQDMLNFGNHGAQNEQVVECEGHNNNNENEGGGGGGERSKMKACKDCGNKAKKGCEYGRCRTCCRGRGYDCSTHVKSTWVPAARRRERQMGVTVAVPGVGGGGDANIKQSLPDKVRAPAVFRCHRVTAISNGAAELAYQATVKISGHVFQGLLYDHGVDKNNAFPCISPSHLETDTNQRNGDSASTPPLPPATACLTSTS